jgi:uncharacterized protein YndB with AHSA1/START domain
MFLKIIFLSIFILYIKLLLDNKITMEVEINTKPETVWEYLIKEENVKQWISGFEKSIPLNEKELKIGTKSTSLISKNMNI